MSYFDRYVSLQRGDIDYCLVSIVCVLVASKFLELKVPALSELTSNFTQTKYTRTQLKDAELKLLSCLGWKLHHVTPHAFLERLTELQGDLSEVRREGAECTLDWAQCMCCIVYCCIVY